MKRTRSKKINEENPSKKLKTDSEETEPCYINSLPKDMEILLCSFITSKTGKDWNNISLVSKHWNSIAWISFQRTIPNKEKEEIFLKACQRGQNHFITKLLKQDITFDPSFDDNRAIRAASRMGFIDVVKPLLQNERIDPSEDDNFAIRAASYSGRMDLVKLLLQDKRVDPYDDDNWAFRAARMRGKVDIVKLLLQDDRVMSMIKFERR